MVGPRVSITAAFFFFEAELCFPASVSSTLINIPDYGSILLDAGEGTYGQLYRRFNQATEGPNLEDILTRLQMLFISHMHADHHLGAAKVIVERKKVKLCF